MMLKMCIALSLLLVTSACSPDNYISETSTNDSVIENPTLKDFRHDIPVGTELRLTGSVSVQPSSSKFILDYDGGGIIRIKNYTSTEVDYGDEVVIYGTYEGKSIEDGLPAIMADEIEVN